MTSASKIWLLFIAFVVGVMSPLIALDIDDLQPTEILNPDPATQDYFGSPVAIYGNRMVVGANGDDEKAIDAGAAYAYRRIEGGSWVLEQKLMASDGAASDAFGRDVDIHGDWIVVGAYRDDDNGTDSGSAYVFKRNGGTWTECPKLLPDSIDGGADSTDWFGFSVGIDSSNPVDNPDDTLILTTAVVGAPQDEGLFNRIRSGSVYTFQLSEDCTSWMGGVPIAPGASDAFQGDEFGIAVDIAGDGIVVGAWEDINNSVTAGAAYFIRRQNIVGAWGLEWKYSKGNPGGRFGAGVALDVTASGEWTVVVGEPGNGVGAAWVYRGNTNSWAEEQLGPASTTNVDSFGDDVGIDFPLLLASAPLSDFNGTNDGAVYVFEKVGSTWTERGKLLPANPAPGGSTRLGERVAIDLTTISGSAPLWESAPTPWDQGKNYVFDAAIFADGFESGDVSAWSSSVP
jgi:hypothetical protein